ncbi:MAG: hypothetical protein QJR01_09380 [Kyrpidia sp.]|nr:hypothetical protein [Kyrpidia sp.]
MDTDTIWAISDEVAMTLTLGGLGIWALLDAFFIGRRLAFKNSQLEVEIINKVKVWRN